MRRHACRVLNPEFDHRQPNCEGGQNEAVSGERGAGRSGGWRLGEACLGAGGCWDLRGQEPGERECWPGIKRNQSPKRQVGDPVYMEASLAADGSWSEERSRGNGAQKRDKSTLQAIGRWGKSPNRGEGLAYPGATDGWGGRTGAQRNRQTTSRKNDAKVGSYRQRQTELATRGRDVLGKGTGGWRLKGDSDSGGGRCASTAGRTTRVGIRREEGGWLRIIFIFKAQRCTGTNYGMGSGE